MYELVINMSVSECKGTIGILTRSSEIAVYAMHSTNFAENNGKCSLIYEISVSGKLC